MWTKNGSIPQEETDGTDGWIEAPAKPDTPDGKEVVWLNWQWVVRDPKPDDRDGYRWKWNHDAYQWIEYALPQTLSTEQIESLSSSQLETLTSYNIQALMTDQIEALTTEQVSGLQ